MNMYDIIAIIIGIILLGHFFNLGPAIEQFANRLADIPPFTDKGTNPAIFDLAVRLAYMIAFVGIIRLLVSRRKDEDE